MMGKLNLAGNPFFFGHMTMMVMCSDVDDWIQIINVEKGMALPVACTNMLGNWMK